MWKCLLLLKLLLRVSVYRAKGKTGAYMCKLFSSDPKLFLLLGSLSYSLQLQ